MVALFIEHHCKMVFQMVNFPDDCTLFYESPKTIFLINGLY